MKLHDLTIRIYDNKDEARYEMKAMGLEGISGKIEVPGLHLAEWPFVEGTVLKRLTVHSGDKLIVDELIIPEEEENVPLHDRNE